MSPVVGIAGLGRIGSAAAGVLRDAGYDVIGLARTPRPALAEAGVAVTADPRALVDAAEVILGCLPGPAESEAVVAEILRDPGAVRVFADAASGPLAHKARLRDALAGTRAAYLDCEISGLPPQVAARGAVIFVSGDAEAAASIRPVLDALADRHFMLGAFGAATKMKLVANTMVCIHNLMAAEALNLGARAGLDPATMVDVLRDSAAGSNTFRFKAPLMAARRFEEAAGPFGFMFGYLERAGDMAAAAGAATPLLDAARALYDRARDEGRHAQDIAAILEVVEARNAP